MPESNELHEARRLFRAFEQNLRKPEGINALAEALVIISDLRDNAEEEWERKVADNLFNTYAQKAVEHAQNLLADLDSIPDDDLEHWHDVMHEFVLDSLALPEAFLEKKKELISSLIKRIFQRMPPSEQRKFLAR